MPRHTFYGQLVYEVVSICSIQHHHLSFHHSQAVINTDLGHSSSLDEQECQDLSITLGDQPNLIKAFSLEVISLDEEVDAAAVAEHQFKVFSLNGVELKEQGPAISRSFFGILPNVLGYLLPRLGIACVVAFGHDVAFREHGILDGIRPAQQL